MGRPVGVKGETSLGARESHGPRQGRGSGRRRRRGKLRLRGFLPERAGASGPGGAVPAALWFP